MAICSEVWLVPRVRMVIVPFSVSEPAALVIAPVAVESEGTEPPMALTACAKMASDCVSRVGVVGAGCVVCGAIVEETARERKKTRETRIIISSRCATSDGAEPGADEGLLRVRF